MKNTYKHHFLIFLIFFIITYYLSIPSLNNTIYSELLFQEQKVIHTIVLHLYSFKTPTLWA